MIPHSRIAPTPSGYLHLGNAYNFLLTYLLVRPAGGSLRLRIDDLDAPRVRPEYVADIFETLRWLGIAWQEGPADASEANHFSQSLRRPRYEALLQELAGTGRVFACTCSRQQVLAQSTDGQYPGTCRLKGLPLDMPDAAWRLTTPSGTTVTFNDRLAGPQTVDLYQTNRDFVVRRRDRIPAYHVASVADDLDYGVNTIVRGADLTSSTAAQLYLSEVLPATAFAETAFYHHPLLQDEDGQKLSKSAGSTSIRHFRESGGSPETVLQMAAQWLEQTGAARLLPPAVVQRLQAGQLPKVTDGHP